jgi:gliding motility-associated-like protein
MYYFTRIFQGRKVLLLLLFLITSYLCLSQPPQCTLPGSTPSKAILVCGNKPFIQGNVTSCDGGNIFVPKFCKKDPFAPIDTFYKVYSPLYYKFKCYKAGTLGFVITPDNILNSSVDFDWQLYDITGKDPEQNIYTNTTLIVTGFWLETGGHKGAIAAGVPYFQCIPIPPVFPPVDPPHYGRMATLIEGHEYLLLIARTTDFTSGFKLNFEEGTAVITDTLMPKMVTSKAECSGKEITVKLNKPINCNSLTATGSEFTILPAVSSVVSASAAGCSSSNAFDELTLTLSSALTAGNYQLVINNGVDGNTLLDICDNAIAGNQNVTFDFTIPQPIFADSVGKPDCTPDSVKIYFPKKINCSSISANGSDFLLSGPQAETIVAASGNCINGKTDYVSVRFDQRITTKGNYQLTLKAGDDGSVIVDECGMETPVQTINFSIADTVNAGFSYTTKFGCQRDTLTFAHNGANDVNNWKWIFNKTVATTQSPAIIWSAKSTNEVRLLVSNGTCIDSANATIILDNEVRANFEMTDMTCPEDKLEVTNTSTGIVDAWRWNYDIIGSSSLKTPPPFLFPTLNKEAYYSVKLVAFNYTLNCSDSIRKTLTVLDHCMIGVANAFTPNNDGLNDSFWPHNALKADNLVFKVYNRFGQLLFQSRTWRDKWDGKREGVLQPTGVYIWVLSYIHHDTKKQVFQKGTVTLIR